MRRWSIWILLLLLAVIFIPSVVIYRANHFSRPSGPFLVDPYLQLGDPPPAQQLTALSLLWQAPPEDRAAWTVEVKVDGSKQWRSMGQAKTDLIAFDWLQRFRTFSLHLTGLTPGKKFYYRVLKDGQPVFMSYGFARKPPSDPTQRFVVFGDLGTGSEGEKKIAYQVYMAKPDLIGLAGDIVYSHGTMSEYWRKYFPIYNCDSASPARGAPVIRSILTFAAPGNHDTSVGSAIDARNLYIFPDGLAYFYLWSQPLDGPIHTFGAPNTPSLLSPPTRQEAFLAAAGSHYPAMANFSFDYGNAHWTVLDANPYMDWTNPQLRQWLENDLRQSGQATWHFVMFHQPGFNSDVRNHFNEQRMRLIADILEKYHVDLVFSGHAHNYQRTVPIRFQVQRQKNGRLMAANGTVDGHFDLDKSFDGAKNTTANGVIYIVTGGGGAPLGGKHLTVERGRWQPWTADFVGTVFSFTCCDVHDRTLTLRQIDADGHELDRITITKPASPQT